MAPDPTAAYRKQQGLAPITQSYDPKVVGWIVQAAKQTGADPAALLATAIQESGARRGAVGDQGTSFGPFQMHRGGALGSHSPAWANTYAPVLNRAQEYKRLQVHGGKGAAAVQRPADRALYARGVDTHLEQARAILAKYGLTPPAAQAPAASRAPVTPARAFVEAPDFVGNALIQSLIDANAENAGISSITLPAAPVISATPTPTLTPSKPSKTPQKPVLTPTGRVTLLQAPKIIGTPYSGTHTIGNWQSDNAVDIAMPEGTPIYAPTNGVIGSRIGSLGSSSSRFAGLRVNLKGGGNDLYYAHLSRLAVKAGQRVKAGQIIGYSGSANGVQHLHLGVRKGDPRRYA